MTVIGALGSTVQGEFIMIPTLIANVLWLAFMTLFFILCLASTRGYKAQLDETEVRMRSIISDD